MLNLHLLAFGFVCFALGFVSATGLALWHVYQEYERKNDDANRIP